MLQEFAEWSQVDPVLGSGTFKSWQVTKFLITRNFVHGPSGRRVVAFGEGVLETDPTKQFLHSPPGDGGRLQAMPGKMYFHDRPITVPDPRPPSGPFGDPPLYEGPFNGKNTDSFRLVIDIQTGRTIYIDLTWGFTNALELRCGNGVLYGFSVESDPLPWACVISLVKEKITTGQEAIK